MSEPQCHAASPLILDVVIQDVIVQVLYSEFLSN